MLEFVIGAFLVGIIIVGALVAFTWFKRLD